MNNLWELLKDLELDLFRLREGKRLSGYMCDKCHNLIMPPASGWVEYVKEGGQYYGFSIICSGDGGCSLYDEPASKNAPECISTPLWTIIGHGGFTMYMNLLYLGKIRDVEEFACFMVKLYSPMFKSLHEEIQKDSRKKLIGKKKRYSTIEIAGLLGK